ncbi:MAG: class I poly(R)-hydroxyalkanoic acid synthase [Gammaproteobacteria bacterium]|nr:class I poly(R)-hydroxyalkanoic acid synthase [Gammaproteobacteria bacterium]
MSEKPDKSSGMPDLGAMTSEFLQLLEKNQQAFAKLIATPPQAIGKMLDPFNVLGSFKESAKGLTSDPARLMKANLDLWQQHMQLWQSAAAKVLGDKTGVTTTADKGDKRFKSGEWDENPIFDFIKQSYLITSRWLMDTMSNIEGMSEADAKKVQFHTKQLADAMSPSNFLLTNPDVIKATIDSGGQNLVRGMQNLARDIKAGDGKLKIAMTDENAFELGVNVATTPGKIVYQNDILQLIQYEPTTEEVYRRPLVIFPPWINKYYILDLQPENSFVRWAVGHGYTVFVVSWVNPDQKLSGKTMEDYLNEGVLETLDAVEAATGESEVNLIGYCIGGTLTGAALAYMAAKKDERVKATTFFAAQMDFSEAGDLKVFIDEKQLDSLEEQMAETGYLEGSAMSTAFNLLRSNDLIWSSYVNNYLLGKDPMKFDLLYWNADATRMPRALHMFYLRECYLKNNLAKPGGISLNDTPIDLGKVTMPIYLQSAREDHIAPYPSVFKAKNLFSGPVRFMLAGSGHIAGVINPPCANKYNYWMNEEQPDDLDAWLAGAESRPGSWWDDWNTWLAPLSGEMVAARKPGDGELDIIEDAPGSYAKIKS